MKAIIYDLDGTLINSIEDLMDALQALIFRLGGKAVEREELFDLLEVGSRKLMEALESRPDGLTDVDLFEMFNNEYETRLWNKTEPYEGVREMLEAVAQRGCLQAVVTNKIDRLAQRVCAHFFPGVFELCIGT
ncbi:MAG: HAD hydrolase-like protein, partial [Tissierellia bacterium]|nr:HAD hydrolase-like protein [Tissierellia bacterium]